MLIIFFGYGIPTLLIIVCVVWSLRRNNSVEVDIKFVLSEVDFTRWISTKEVQINQGRFRIEKA